MINLFCLLGLHKWTDVLEDLRSLTKKEVKMMKERKAFVLPKGNYFSPDFNKVWRLRPICKYCGKRRKL